MNGTCPKIVLINDALAQHAALLALVDTINKLIKHLRVLNSYKLISCEKSRVVTERWGLIRLLKQSKALQLYFQGKKR